MRILVRGDLAVDSSDICRLCVGDLPTWSRLNPHGERASSGDAHGRMFPKPKGQY